MRQRGLLLTETTILILYKTFHRTFETIEDLINKIEYIFYSLRHIFASKFINEQNTILLTVV